MTLFKGKYRTSPTRLPGWDYTSAGGYFVTICTKDRVPFFGEIIDGKMHLSPQGRIVSDEWVKTDRIRSNVTLDEWIVMPNHLHGIVVMAEAVGGPHGETPHRGVSTAWQSGTLVAIVGQFKSICTKRIRRDGYSGFAWQPRYYDHIIRDEASLARIREYIAVNPLKWPDDEYHIEDPAASQVFHP